MKLSTADIAAAGEELQAEGKVSVSEVATALDTRTASEGAGDVAGYSTSFGASVFDNPNLSISQAADISNEHGVNVAVGHMASIFDDTNLSLSKAASIMDDDNLSSSKASNILQHSNLGADRTQDILYHDNLSHSKRVGILAAGASDLTVSTDQTITGVVRYGTVTINSGYTLTHDGQPGILICESLTNDGTYDKTPTGGAGAAAPTSPGDGGDGGGGLIFFTNTFDNNSTVQANGENGEDGDTTGTSANADNGGDNTDLLLVSGDSAGDGGDSWDCGHADWTFAAARFGGTGGGNGTYDTSSGGARNTTSYDDASALANHIMKYCVDWWIQNVAGKTPTSTEPQPNPDGAGGGGGCEDDTDADTGGGGGTGGEVIVRCRNFDNTGSISADGGDGGDGGAEGGEDSGGGGGAGSIVYGLYQTLTNEGTLSASGGAKGATPDCAGECEDGTAGTAKTYQV